MGCVSPAQRILVAETGTASMGLGLRLMPAGASFHNQTLWGSIGWATPAAFGARSRPPPKRGAGHRRRLASAHRPGDRPIRPVGLQPVIFVLNNSGYLIERLLCKDPRSPITISRHGVTPSCHMRWAARLVHRARDHLRRNSTQHWRSPSTGGDVLYIEVVTDAYAASPLALKLHESLRASISPERTT